MEEIDPPPDTAQVYSRSAPVGSDGSEASQLNTDVLFTTTVMGVAVRLLITGLSDTVILVVLVWVAIVSLTVTVIGQIPTVEGAIQDTIFPVFEVSVPFVAVQI